jgi:hypothetical protein
MNNTSMFKILWANRPAKFFLILSVGALFCLSSCNKASLLGLDVQPENDLIDADYVDSLTLLTQTVHDDTLRTDVNIVPSVCVLGKYQDPVFGQSQASLYTQVRMFSTAPVFPKDAVCESVTLSLIYIDTYGKKIRHPQTISVYELKDDLDINTSYFSNQTKAMGTTDLANYVFIPRPKDSVLVDSVKQAPQLRVPLPVSLGQNILKLDSTALATNENFIKAIKGFYITTANTSGLASSEGNIIQFYMNTSTLSVRYRYSRASLGLKDTIADFYLSLSGVARFMHFDHDYTNGATPDLQKQIGPSPSPQNDIGYVQAMGGVKTRVKMPYLVQWGKKDFIGINRAELIVKSMVSRKDTFALPQNLSLFAINDDGVTMSVLPDQFEGTGYFGGTMDTTDLATNYPTYHFTITRYIQQLISERRLNNGLFITSNGGSSSANRIVFGGGAAILNGGGENKYQMKLKITYTKLK